MEKEGPLTMQVHGAMFGGVGYFVMTQIMEQKPDVALARSVLLMNVVANYMILFGHGPPKF